MAYPYNPMTATRAADYRSLMDYTSPQAVPMFSQGQGIPSYVPPTQAPATNGMDWGFSQPKFEFNDSALASVVPTGSAPKMSLLDNLSSSDFWFGGKDNIKGTQTNGAASTALGLAQGLMSGYMGMKQYGLNKDIFENNKQQFERNFGAQAKLINASLQDRQARRVREAIANGNPSSATSVADYMAKYGVA